MAFSIVTGMAVYRPGRDLGLSSLTAMSKKTAKRRAKARRKKANHRRKPNAR